MVECIVICGARGGTGVSGKERLESALSIIVLHGQAIALSWVANELKASGGRKIVPSMVSEDS
jgi:hypothetical protein